MLQQHVTITILIDNRPIYSPNNVLKDFLLPIIIPSNGKPNSYRLRFANHINIICTLTFLNIFFVISLFYLNIII